MYNPTGGVMNRSLLVLLITISMFPRTLLSQPTETKLTASDGEQGDGFGVSVSISGDYAVVGAGGDANCSGSAYVFRRDGTAWIEETKLTASDGAEGDEFGVSVSISGDYAVVGAYGDANYRGSAYVFRQDGTAWVEETKLTASDGAEGDSFGWSVSISGDYAVVGAGGDANYSGSAYVFRRDGTAWVDETKLTASDGAAYDNFGRSVSISGHYAVVGASGDDDNGLSSGSAYVFRRDGTAWVEETKLTARDGTPGHGFGESVSISGDDAFVGASGDDDNGLGSGSAYVFRRDGTAWVEKAKLIASDGAAYDYFGGSVSISGDYAVVAAVANDDNGEWSGSAYVFRRDGPAWVEEAKLTASDGAAYDYFGRSVSISGDDAVVGAFLDDDNGEGSGSAYVYGGFGENAISVTAMVSPDSGSGVFDYHFSVTKSGTTSINADLWTEFVAWNGRTAGVVSYGRTIEPGTYSKSGTERIGDNAPAGEYKFVVNVGTYPDSVIASGSAGYTKTSALAKDGSATGTGVPSEFALLQNHPNPFNPTTAIRYQLPAVSRVVLSIYDVLGREVETLVNEVKEAGTYEIIWGEGIPSGIYYSKLEATGFDGPTGHFVQVRKMILIK
jgi:hypothetical protein